ncbi:MFS transporter [Sphingobacterium puteale]|uniref:MFS transporter n=1 Tax=Sphingobacterium puteale TaxID=2420510 RepID=UPI001FE84EFD|nr:MFS transporter [Sphingobacterium puteale]
MKFRVRRGDLYSLVPEVISYGEYKIGKRISGIVNALTGIFYKTGMALGGIVPGLVLAYVAFDKDNVVTQSDMAEKGIQWLLAVIPAILLLLAMYVISKYELDDATIDKINREIESKVNY